MKATVVSNSKNIYKEFEDKLNASLSYAVKDTMLDVINEENTDIVFCCDLELPIKEMIGLQESHPGVTIVFNAVGMTVESLIHEGLSAKNVIGMNLLPTFVNRDLAEITLDDRQPGNPKVLEELGWELKQVKSRVGLVTPRVIFMIIIALYSIYIGSSK